MKYRRVMLLALLVGLEVTDVVAPGHAAPPRTVTLAGEDLVLSGIGTRELLLFDLYTVALYLPEPTASVERIGDRTVPKAFFVEVDYDGSAPDGIPEEWREELLPAPSDGQTDDLRRALRTLDEGDVVHIAYRPGVGTAVDLNGEPVVRDPGHALIEGVIELWLGPDAVSDDLRRGLLYGGE